MREDPDGVPRGRGDRRGLLAFPADVADRHPPAAGGAVHVVEVAADLEALGGRDVGRRDLHAGNLGQLARQQARLERVSDLAVPPEHPVHPDRQGQLLAEFLYHAEVGHLEVALAGIAGQGQGAVGVLSVGQRHAEHGRGVEHHHHRHALRPGPEDPGVLRVRDEQRAA